LTLAVASNRGGYGGLFWSATLACNADIVLLARLIMFVSEQQELGERVDCTVIVVTYNSARDIVGLLESLPASAAGLTLRTVVVDNGSTDATVQLVRSRPHVTCVESGANLGYAAGVNIGRAYAGECSALLVLNPDVVLEAGALREMFSGLDEPDVGIVVPTLQDADDQLYPSLRREPTLTRALGEGLLGDHVGWRPGWLSEIVRGEKHYEYRHSVDWATGAAMLVSAACDRSVGRWDEQFFLYSEEVDYAARARDAGFRVQYLPAARALHRGGGSGQSDMLIALLAVNRIRYVEKRGRGSAAYRAAVILHELLRSGDPGHRTALRAVLRRSTWPGLQEGLRTPLADPIAATAQQRLAEETR
jgi:GT2 family glycosyltransferase